MQVQVRILWFFFVYASPCCCILGLKVVCLWIYQVPEHKKTPYLKLPMYWVKKHLPNLRSGDTPAIKRQQQIPPVS